MRQLYGLKYILRQGLAIRGHTEVEGNLHQLLISWSNFDTASEKWISANKYSSHDIVNEQIEMIGLALLRTLLEKVHKCTPWYALIGDEATDVASQEQFNLSIRWVDSDYTIHEDPIGLFCLPNTTSETLFAVVKDILIRCALPLAQCRGQAYDGASNMQGKRNGLVTRIKREVPAALSVHCFAHSLNLCLQDVARQLTFIRDALDVVREIAKIKIFS